MKSGAEVVITGLGAVTAAGLNVEETWNSLTQGRQSVSQLNINIQGRCYSYGAGQVDDFSGPKSMDRCVQFALHCAYEALAQAGLIENSEYLRKAACVFSMSKPSPGLFAELYQLYKRDGSLAGKDLVSTTWPNSCCVEIANHYGLIGPRLSIPTACATGAQTIIRAVGLILDGQAECVIAGASEASLTELYLASFDRMGVLGKNPGHPESACRPFDRRRNGFVVAEGAAAVVVESARAAQRRGVIKPLARVKGYWQGMHALDLLKLEPDGQSLAKGIREALGRSGVVAEELDYICAHGTGTVANDASETAAIKLALGSAARRTSISSHKGAIGRLLAAAGAVGVVSTVKSIVQDLVPPTVNLEEPDPACDLDYTPRKARQRPIRNALCIAGGFGGQCGLIVLSKPDIKNVT